MSESISCRLRWRGQTTGPFPLETILRRLDDNELGLWHEIDYEGSWMTLEEFLSRTGNEGRTANGTTHPLRPRLATARPAAPPDGPPAAPVVPVQAPPAPGPSPAPPRIRTKRLGVFLAAGFLLGFVGAHNFYAGYRGTAAAQLLLCCALCWLGFGLIATWTWALIELLVVRTDHRGVPLI